MFFNICSHRQIARLQAENRRLAARVRGNLAQFVKQSIGSINQFGHFRPVDLQY